MRSEDGVGLDRKRLWPQNNPIISAELFRTLSPQFHPEEQIHVAQSH